MPINLDEEIEITLSPRTTRYYEKLGYEIPRYKDKGYRLSVKRGTKIKVKIKDLSRDSSVELNGVCDKCNKPFSIKMQQYYKRKNKGDKFLCNECYFPNRYVSRYSYEIEFEKIQNYIKFFNYNLVDNEIKSRDQHLILSDYEGYLYSLTLYQVGKYTHNKFDVRNPFTLQNIKLWCKLNDKPFELLDNQIYKGNKNKLKWQCFKEDCGEIFDSCWNDIYDGHGCGMCDKHQVGLSNCLATLNPELAKEWHSTKNGDLTPFDVAPGSDKKVWWQCEKGHEWKINIFLRNGKSKSGCPDCNKSKGEKMILELLINKNMNYISQYTFPDCKYKQVLQFDFYLPDYNICIEYQGVQHYEPVDFAGNGEEWAKAEFKLIQFKDQIKRNYCNKNNIKLIEISYLEFNDINIILENISNGNEVVKV